MSIRKVGEVEPARVSVELSSSGQMRIDTNVEDGLLVAKLLSNALGAVLDQIHAALGGLDDAVGTAARCYGGGLVKVEPGELAAVPLPGSLGRVINRLP